MSYHIKKIYFLIFIIFPFYSFSQNAVIKGKVTDGSNAESIPGVNVSLESQKGTVTDLKGSFLMELEPGRYQITFSFIGYSSVKRNITLNKGEVKTINIQLNEESRLLNTVVVSGSAYEKKIAEEIISIDVIKPYLIQNTNATDISQVIERVPGVKITDGQINIRGGSGYSYGTGSRVQVIVDGQSYLSPDLGEVRWKFIPTDNIEQVEVIKDASSVLYGSASMDGVVNVLTGWPKSEPETYLTFYQGIYLNPKRSELAWWGRETQEIHRPMFTGLSLLHKQKIKNLDVVADLTMNYNSSYLKDIDEYKAGFNCKLRYRLPKLNRLTLGLNGNIMYEQNMRFTFFTNSDDGAYIPFPGSITYDRYLIATLNPYVQYFTKKGNRHLLRLMYFGIEYIRLLKYYEPTANTPASLITLTYQFQKKIRKNIIWTTGIDASYAWVKNNYMFSGVTPYTFFAGLYTQIEQKFNRLTVQAGLRDEVYGLTGLKDMDPDVYEKVSYNTIAQTSSPTFRGGLNYKMTKSTFLRTSFGQAYRFPAVSEVFLHGSIADQLSIFPNIDLKPELGWNIEVGAKQEVKLLNWKGYLDVALFWMELKNYITYTFSKFGNGNNMTDFGFKATNISQARITGFEVSAIGEGTVGPLSVRIFGGYTYIYPGDLESDPSQRNLGKYFSNLWSSIKRDSVGINSILPYRNRHIVRLDIECGYKNLGLGFSLNYNSPIERIDDYYKLLDTSIKGISSFTEKYAHGTLLLDARISYTYKGKHKISFLVKNLLNVEYADRPGLVGPPRTIALQYHLEL